jgi:sec-independent protein translocase protein TatA
MGELSPAHLVLVLVIALLVIGPGKLPETGAALGRAVRDFRHALGGTEQAATPGNADPVTPEPSQTVPMTGTGAAADKSGST